MQKNFNEFQNLFRNKTIAMENKHLQKILYKIEFLFLPNNFNDILTKYLQNKSKIFIIDEYKDEKEDKYLFVCFDYKLIILNYEKSLQYLSNFFSQQEHLETYFLNENSIF